MALTRLQPPDVNHALRYLAAAVALRPHSASAHLSLATVLEENKELQAAISEYRRAIKLDPEFAMARAKLGVLLAKEGKELDASVAELRAAIKLDPNLTPVHNALGIALYRKDDFAGAVAAYRQAIAADPDDALAHCLLGQALLDQGEFAEAAMAFRRGHELGLRQPGFTFPSAEGIASAERLHTLNGKLPAFLKGNYQATDTQERLLLAQICRIKKRHTAAVKVLADAFAADPKVADDVKSDHRYNGVCSAALAGTGRAEDAAWLDDKERARLRQQALDWLRAELVSLEKLLTTGKPEDREYVADSLRHWQHDPDLAGLRNAAITELPATERDAWKKLWSDVQALLQKSQIQPKS
jgi:tetratricopeptide (TPR) repeat protein